MFVGTRLERMSKCVKIPLKDIQNYETTLNLIIQKRKLRSLISAKFVKESSNQRPISNTTCPFMTKTEIFSFVEWMVVIRVFPQWGIVKDT